MGLPRDTHTLVHTRGVAFACPVFERRVPAPPDTVMLLEFCTMGWVGVA